MRESVLSVIRAWLFVVVVVFDRSRVGGRLCFQSVFSMRRFGCVLVLFWLVFRRSGGFVVRFRSRLFCEQGCIGDSVRASCGVFGSFAGVCGQPTFLGAFLVFPDLRLLGLTVVGSPAGIVWCSRAHLRGLCGSFCVRWPGHALLWIAPARSGARRPGHPAPGRVGDRPCTFGSTQTLFRKPFPPMGVDPAGA